MYVGSSSVTMEDTDFYITLPSNANMDKYPDNRPGKFKVDLSQRHELHDGVWELGLTEIQFTNNWRYRTPEFDMVVWLGWYPDMPGRHKTRPENYVMSDEESRLLDVQEANMYLGRMITQYVKVPAGDWRDEKEFGSVLAVRLKAELNKRIELTHNDGASHPRLKSLRYERDGATKRAEFIADDDAVGRSLCITTEHSKIMEILGLTLGRHSADLEAAGKKVKVYEFAEDNETAQPIIAAFPAVEVMFVYSSVCEEQHIGDQAGNLLKAVPVTVEQGKRQCERYSPATYARLRPSTLDSIDIQLLDKTGAEVPFADVNSVVVMQLHVRKRRSALGWY